MDLTALLDRIRHNLPVSFQETMATINRYYDYQPTEFSNGIGDSQLLNAAGHNEGSCRIFAFAKLHDLSPTETLALFGDFYRQDVLENPDGTDHQNIRHFMRFGWEGIVFSGQVLTQKSA